MFPQKSEEGVMINFVNPRKDRSSCLQMLFKVGLLKNFGNFTGKNLCCRPCRTLLFYRIPPMAACGRGLSRN